ncbi:hypothetical protein Q3G72_020744 [Acer saccharum]|nr:hypothetical protein Q3G72_020744 [Acer saccharum]
MFAQHRKEVDGSSWIGEDEDVLSLENAQDNCEEEDEHIKLGATVQTRQRCDKFSIFRIMWLSLVEKEKIDLRFLVTAWLLWHNRNRMVDLSKIAGVGLVNSLQISKLVEREHLYFKKRNFSALIIGGLYPLATEPPSYRRHFRSPPVASDVGRHNRFRRSSRHRQNCLKPTFNGKIGKSQVVWLFRWDELVKMWCSITHIGEVRAMPLALARFDTCSGSGSRGTRTDLWRFKF